MPSKNIDDLIQELQDMYYEFESRCQEEGIEFRVTCTYRPQEEQNELYAQGRTKPGKIVTKTLKSKHTQRRAFDIVIVLDGKATYDDEALPYYHRAREIWLDMGGKVVEWDLPHYEI